MTLKDVIVAYMGCDKCSECQPGKRGIAFSDIASLSIDSDPLTSNPLDLYILASMADSNKSTEEKLEFIKSQLQNGLPFTWETDLMDERIRENVKPTFLCIIERVGDFVLPNNLNLSNYL